MDASYAPSAAERLTACVMIATGVVIALVFAGGATGLLVDQLVRLIDGRADLRALMEILLVAPLAGGAPALLGLVMARNGWRRLHPAAETPDDLPPDGS